MPLLCPAREEVPLLADLPGRYRCPDCGRGWVRTGNGDLVPRGLTSTLLCLGDDRVFAMLPMSRPTTASQVLKSWGYVMLRGLLVFVLATFVGLMALTLVSLLGGNGDIGPAELLLIVIIAAAVAIVDTRRRDRVEA